MKIFYLPDLGEGLAEAEIREWYVKVGDEVKVDQPLVSMETAKAVVDVPSPYDGKIVKLHGKENDIIQTGAAFISFQTDEKSSEDQGSVVGKLESGNSTWQEEETIIGKNSRPSQAIKALPAARLLAKELNVNLEQVTGSGPGGLITADDVKKISSGAPSKTKIQGEALHGVRRSMAQAMTHSHQEVVPVTIFEDANITHLASKTDLTVLLLKAIVNAAQAEPAMNAWFEGKTMERKLLTDINIGLAIDSTEGLFVPVIKDVKNKDEKTLRDEVNKLKKDVMERKVSSKDLQGASFTLSNFGMIAGRYATPIVVPPMVGILATGRSREAVYVKDSNVTMGRILPLSLTFDHRAVTGGEATRFLKAILNHLET